MHQKNNLYKNNPVVHKNRRLSQHPSAWVRSFACEDIKPLIVCRGPIRKETMDVLNEMGIHHFGILLSEKDSITYTHALAPELRLIKDHARIHRVPDYTGASKQERIERIQQMIKIAQQNGYNSVFAGYGFMAEDPEFIETIENAKLTFIGPNSQVARKAGLKDEAKKIARAVNVSVTPGIDQLTALTLLAQYSSLKKLKELCDKHKLNISPKLWDNTKESTPDQMLLLAEEILAASYHQRIDLITVEQMIEQMRHECTTIWKSYPKSRIRLKSISGGGGKGQRIISEVDQVSSAIYEILNETKCTGVGDNKNILAELNIEKTRHNEIQLIGNGQWSLALGGRDCSIQMHEQKLLEISVTQELLSHEIKNATVAQSPNLLTSLKQDLENLKKMEQEAETFGQAVGLDSVSTFECIVEDDHHFFMEMNTRIQVEHRVTEMVYSLEFTNPENAQDKFVVDSLVEAMVILARHKKRVPQPKRILRFLSGGEVRLNATDDALSPHAGGQIQHWSDPIADEIRDDQGICLRNPDTDLFMRYRLAGAYDSNVALLVTYGPSRLENYKKLSNILRCTTVRGQDLAINLQFHYGLINWFLGQQVMSKPTTAFAMPYLTAVGELKQESQNIDVDALYEDWCKLYLSKKAKQINTESSSSVIAATKTILQIKKTLITRPIKKLMSNAHMLAGWIGLNNNHSFHLSDRKVVWRHNPIDVLADLYHYLRLENREHVAAVEKIWPHDFEILSQAQAFYRDLCQQLKIPSTNFAEINNILLKTTPPASSNFSLELWTKCHESHVGYQLGLELLQIVPLIAQQTQFFDLHVNEHLEINIPERLKDKEHQKKMMRVLSPPPQTKSDEILALRSGMFYAQESPAHPPFLTEGQHFKVGDPIYIIEVMKMFNKILAPFSGTVKEVCIKENTGVIVTKGQLLFKIIPDEKIIEESEQEVLSRQKKIRDEYLNRL